MNRRGDTGFALIPLIGSVVAGGLLAFVASFSLVSSQTATPDPVDTPLITYDAS